MLMGRRDPALLLFPHKIRIGARSASASARTFRSRSLQGHIDAAEVGTLRANGNRLCLAGHAQRERAGESVRLDKTFDVAAVDPSGNLAVDVAARLLPRSRKQVAARGDLGG